MGEGGDARPVGKGVGRGAASHVVQRRFLGDGDGKVATWDGVMPHERWPLTRTPPRAHHGSAETKVKYVTRHNPKWRQGAWTGRAG